MKLPENVRVKIGKKIALAIYPNIFLPKNTYEDLKSNNPDSKNVAILLHEQTHIERQRKIGWVRWGIRYLSFPGFRFGEELAADRARFAYLKKHKVKFDFEKRAKDLSSWVYLWCTSYKKAKKELEEVWKEI